MIRHSSIFGGSNGLLFKFSAASSSIGRIWFVLMIALLIDSPVFVKTATTSDDLLTFGDGGSTSLSPSADPNNCANPGLFRCPSTGRCIPRSWMCDGDNDCGRSEDEINCLEKKCAAEEYKCVNSQKCIPQRWLCDSEDDCGDHSDEHPILCENRTCAPDQFKCKNTSQCIPNSWLCDTQPDCGDGSDEEDCRRATCSSTEFKCNNGRCIFNRWKCDHDDDCGDNSDEGAACNYSCVANQFQCKSDKRCVPDRWQCDGEPDCSDHSDELNCSQITKQHRNTTCNPIFEFQCNDGPCIHKAWQCDGDKDCPDGSDEENCRNRSRCTQDEFTCSLMPLRCIPKGARCNNIKDCIDGKDEEGCPTAPSQPKPCEQGKQFDCGGGYCIPLEFVCNKNPDCPQNKSGLYADESPAIDCEARTKADYCAGKPCDSTAICIKGAKGPICICPFGYQPSAEKNKQGQTVCEDIDECSKTRTPRVCTQICHNKKGSYECGCHQGYMLMRDKMTCRALGEHPKLWLSNRVMIREIDLISRRSIPLLTELDSAVAMDYSMERKLVFWSDVAKEIIFKCKIPSASERSENGVSAKNNQRELVTERLSTPDGMAVDWIHDLVYWTDTGLNTISVVDFDGKYRKTLINSSLDEPRAIALDPRDGVMFWTDWGSEAKIEKASMDGTNRITIIKTEIQWPNGLAIDYLDKRIFWADAKLKMISSCNYEGGERVAVLNSWGSLRHPFSLAVFEEKVYWTDWDTEGIHYVNKYSGENSNGSSVLLDGLAGPMTIRIYQEQNQPKAYNKCNNSFCQQLCLPAQVIRSRSSGYNPVPYTCQCADGFILAVDGRNCIKDAKSKSTSSASQGGQFPEQKPAKSGSSAAVAVAVIGCLAMVGACVGFLIWRRMNRNNPRRSKRMNFENPVYRRTVVDDSNDGGTGDIHYDHLRLSVDADQYNPTIDAMSASNGLRHGNSGGGGGGSGSGVYQPTTTTGAESVIGVGVVQNGKYSMTLPLTEHEEGSDYA